MAAVQTRVDALTIRALGSGIVITPRVQELQGHRVVAGDAIMRVAMLDSLEARVALARAGAASVRPGQVVHLISYSAAHPVAATVGAVAPAGSGQSERGTIEARIPVDSSMGWRAGATGEASIELRRSTVLAALWWNVRQRLRGDILL
jgi:hypothetical protein